LHKEQENPLKINFCLPVGIEIVPPVFKQTYYRLYCT